MMYYLAMRYLFSVQYSVLHVIILGLQKFVITLAVQQGISVEIVMYVNHFYLF